MTSRHGAIEIAFGDGEHSFRLGLAEIEELEEKCSRFAGRDVGIFTLARGLAPTVRETRFVYVREVLRLGLIGGGMKPVDALGLVSRYVDARPLDESRDAAYAVVLAALARVHPGELGDVTDDGGGGAPGEAQAAGPGGSTSPPSTPEPR